MNAFSINLINININKMSSEKSAWWCMFVIPTLWQRHQKLKEASYITGSRSLFAI